MFGNYKEREKDLINRELEVYRREKMAEVKAEELKIRENVVKTNHMAAAVGEQLAREASRKAVEVAKLDAEIKVKNDLLKEFDKARSEREETIAILVTELKALVTNMQVTNLEFARNAGNVVALK